MDTNVLIIGAGVSGLIAAIELEKMGISPTILEATNRVGGRVGTTVREGYIMDHGFQVLLTAYPEAIEYLDYAALDLQYFDPGALFYEKGRYNRISDPLRDLSQAVPMVFSSVGSISDKWKVFQLQKELKKTTPEDIFAGSNISTDEYLKGYGFSDEIIEKFFRPFFGGIFLESDLKTSARMFRFVFKMFAEGSAAVPSSGMQGIPDQLQSRLKTTQIQFNSKVESVSLHELKVNGETMKYDRLIVTVPPASVMPGMEPGHVNGVTNMYFTCKKRLSDHKLIMLSGSHNGWVNNMHFVNSVTPMPEAENHLLSVTVVKPHNKEDIREQVALELQQIHGLDVEFFEQFDIPNALPVVEEMAYSIDPRNTRINEHVYMAGDQLLYPSLNAAMHAGKLAAIAVRDSVNS